MKIFLFALFSTGTLFGEEPAKIYQLAEENWEAPVGMRLQVNSERKLSNGAIKFTTDGAWSTGKISSLEKNEIIGERTSKDSYLLEFLSETSQYRMLYSGDKSNERNELPLHKKTVSVDRKDGEWTAKVVEGDLDEVKPDDLEMRLKVLSQNIEFDYAEWHYGVEPRKVGESWEVKLPDLPGMGKGKVESGKATVTFEKIEDLRGHKCAVLTMKFEAKVDYKEFDGGTVEYAGEGKVVRSIEALLDLDFQGKGSLKSIRGTAESSVETTGKYTMSSEIFILPPVEKE